MFTGIITHIGRIASLEKNGDIKLSIKTDMDLSSTPIGASIACSGVCLTIVSKEDGAFAADVSAESLACTNISDWQMGSPINLEKPLKVGEELGGHIVTGHVDDVAIIDEISEDGSSQRLRFRMPKNLARFVAEKGSIALNGVSLTANSVEDRAEDSLMTVNLIPHSLENTAFGDAQTGDKVNVEIDILARYVDRLNKGSK